VPKTPSPGLTTTVVVTQPKPSISVITTSTTLPPTTAEVEVPKPASAGTALDPPPQDPPPELAITTSLEVLSLTPPIEAPDVEIIEDLFGEALTQEQIQGKISLLRRLIEDCDVLLLATDCKEPRSDSAKEGRAAKHNAAAKTKEGFQAKERQLIADLAALSPDNPTADPPEPSPSPPSPPSPSLPPTPPPNASIHSLIKKNLQ
jgi:hypothetical protein